MRLTAPARKRVSAWTLGCTIFFIVNGGPFTTEQVVGNSGPLLGLLILLALPLVWALPVGLLTAELSSAFPEEGGFYLWVKTALGPFPAFLCAWWSWLALWVDLALYPVVAVHYAARLLPHAADKVPNEYAWVLAIIVVFTVLNLFGVRVVGLVSDWMFPIMMAPFLIVLAVGFSHIGQLPSLPMMNKGWTWAGLGAGTAYGLWNYLGWDSLTVASGEVQEAGRKFPKAIGIGLVLVTAAIVLPTAAGVLIRHDYANWNTDSGYWPEIASTAWPALFIPIVIAGTMSNLGQFSTNLLASSRIPYVLAADGYLPGQVCKEHPRFGTPWVAILIAAGISAVFARDRFQSLLAIDISLYLAGLILEFVSLIVLRRRGVTKDAPFRIKGGLPVLLVVTVVPTIVVVVAIGIQLSPSVKLAEVGANPSFVLAGMLLTGPAFYGGWTVVRRVRGVTAT